MKLTKLVGPLLCIAVIAMTGCTPGGSGPTATPPEPTPTPYGEQLSPVEAVASSETAFRAANAIDGIFRTPWKAVGNDVEWITVDLGAPYRVTHLIVYWEPGYEGPYFVPNYAVSYELQISDDGESWTTIRNMVGADGGVDDFTGLDATGRYVRMYATEVSTESGGQDDYEIWEIEIFGETP
jgi:hypothetical protein